MNLNVLMTEISSKFKDETSELRHLRFSERLSDDKVEAFRAGCLEFAVALDETVEKVLESGKRPTIIIPSRGVIPIFLTAMGLLTKESSGIMTLPNVTKYYPEGVFRYLSNLRIPENTKKEGSVDVVLYPFTADVSGDDNRQAEILAQRIRESAVRGLLQYLSPSTSPFENLDSLWNQFLVNKTRMNPANPYDPTKLLDSLVHIPKIPLEDRGLILLDTVISGRAASHIIPAFADFGTPVTAVLAVDQDPQEKKSKYSAGTYRSIIEQSVSPEFPSTYVNMPLISEDTGSHMLGVTAVNIENFNDPNIFSKATRELEGFLPQSCVWVLPIKDKYTAAFHGFLDRCIDGDSSDWEGVRNGLEDIIRQPHGNFQPNLAKGFLKDDVPIRAVRDSSSGIVSLTLPDQYAEKWIREFYKGLLTQTQKRSRN